MRRRLTPADWLTAVIIGLMFWAFWAGGIALVRSQFGDRPIVTIQVRP